MIQIGMTGKCIGISDPQRVKRCFLMKDSAGFPRPQKLLDEGAVIIHAAVIHEDNAIFIQQLHRQVYAAEKGLQDVIQEFLFYFLKDR